MFVPGRTCDPPRSSLFVVGDAGKLNLSSSSSDIGGGVVRDVRYLDVVRYTCDTGYRLRYQDATFLLSIRAILRTN
jgi:hypothetical protein